MRLSLLISLACVLGLAACSASDHGERDLADTCQLEVCDCVADDSSLFDRETTDILWRADGGAYCPEGYHLEAEGKD